jgi:hypothetical protein
MPPKVTLDQAETLAAALARRYAQSQGNCFDDRVRQISDRARQISRDGLVVFWKTNHQEIAERTTD